MVEKCTHTIDESLLAAKTTMSWYDWLSAGKSLFVGDLKKIGTFVRLSNKRMSTRHQLSQLNADVLNDVGLTKEQVQAEIKKPFWKE